MLSILSMVAWMAAASPSVVVEPNWVRKPSAEEMGEHFPIGALNDRVAGKAVILCRVAESGRLNNCSVISEEPAGYGFGMATIGMSGRFEMTPRTVDGVAVDSGVVRVPMAFLLPEFTAGDLQERILCHGLLAAAYDADPSLTHLPAAIQHHSDVSVRLAATLGIPAEKVLAQQARERANPSRDPEVRELCFGKV